MFLPVQVRLWFLKSRCFQYVLVSMCHDQGAKSKRCLGCFSFSATSPTMVHVVGQSCKVLDSWPLEVLGSPVGRQLLRLLERSARSVQSFLSPEQRHRLLWWQIEAELATRAVLQFATFFAQQLLLLRLDWGHSGVSLLHGGKSAQLRLRRFVLCVLGPEAWQ
eukprot:c17795_g1_i1.p1 GENE.c17795_g1_i1~~c17795_g1_i1.p1  ORF type:complete len:163 (+),score=26.34 c17795_g1_i1:145-633(+)